MLWHWLIFLSLLLFAGWEQLFGIGKKSAYRICSIYTILYIFLATIRWDQNLGDWKGYYGVFNWSPINNLKEVFDISYWAFEPLFYLIMRFIKFFTGNYTHLLFVMAFIAIGGFYFSSKYINEKVMLKGREYGSDNSHIFTTFLIAWSTGCSSVYTVRTNIAYAICLLSLRWIEEKKLVRFLLMVALATMFHFTAIIFIPAYFIYHKKLNTKRWLEAMGIVIVLCIIGVDHLIPLVGLLGGRYAEKLNSYNVNVGTSGYSYSNYSGLFLIVRALSNTILVLAIALYIKRKFADDIRFNGLLNIYLLGALIQTLIVPYNLELARVAVYYVQGQFFLLPYAFDYYKNSRANRMIIFMVFALYMGTKMYSLLHSSQDYMTFTTIFSN